MRMGKNSPASLLFLGMFFWDCTSDSLKLRSPGGRTEGSVEESRKICHVPVQQADMNPRSKLNARSSIVFRLRIDSHPYIQVPYLPSSP
ncbi:uncharacterized protein EDB91DRAFT_255281 [Suillus paluster]|uniref:uncharacterized protein n=1 Tax=Suillus paluster TaxID=48578 RepID=UPI001B85F9B1|nr:uncharacterized protein EDB91DRAFT_255281 [Suillus paluster]KAG1754824.1 hypothetical protein EDB91DRAFT_255281 [Suillus paluster]